MFEHEVNSLLDVIAWMDDEELREALKEAVTDAADSLAYRRKYDAQEAADNAARLCRFDEAWRGRCRQPSVNEAGDFCKEHLGITCRSSGCNKQAILTCPVTMGAFCCGAAVCEQHWHGRTGRGDH